MHAILLLSPPLQLTDLFNYLGYARLGAVHHLNPYTHVIADEMHDPVYRFSDLAQPPQPVRAAVHRAHLPVALLPVPVAYWVLEGRRPSL